MTKQKKKPSDTSVLLVSWRPSTWQAEYLTPSLVLTRVYTDVVSLDRFLSLWNRTVNNHMSTVGDTFFFHHLSMYSNMTA